MMPVSYTHLDVYKRQVVTVLPNPIVFGWLPLQLGILLFLPVPAAIVWGIYFNAFFKTQKDLK